MLRVYVVEAVKGIAIFASLTVLWAALCILAGG